MRNKGAILLLVIALTAVCLYQLSFTFKSLAVNKQAKEYAQGDQTKFDIYIDSISNEEVFNLLIKNYTFREVQEREINFGLDLKGGMNIILEVSTYDVLKSLSNNSIDSTFNAALALAKKMQVNDHRDFITIFGDAFKQVDPNAQLAAIFTTPELRDKGITYDTPNEDVLKVIRKEAEGAIDNAFNIISTRIDQFGVVQPIIQRLETKDRILVDLPGIKNKERVRKLLQGTANLEFWETFDNSEVIESLYAADNLVKEYLATQKNVSAETETGLEAETVSQQETEDTVSSPSLLKQIQAEEGASDAALSQDIQNAYPLLSLLSPMQDPETRQPYQGAIVGRAHFKDTTKINRYLAIAREKQIFPRELRFMWGAKADEDQNKKPTDLFSLYAIKVRSRDGKPPLDGDVIISASQEFDNINGQAYVLMAMDNEGTRRWAQLTKENVQKIICIVMDNRVYSGPVVQNEITGGSSQITGNFTPAEAQDLANLLKSGKLPAPARIIQENIVGPSLGQKAINDGVTSFIVAFLIILLYMIFYYTRRAGFIADIALVANMFFIMGVLASIGASLTLPGIAGIVLTIGMSVDANVLIYERIKEELALGKGIRMAVSEGFKNAYSAIIDGNVTTIITGIILYIFGTGAIKGFATTLIIGICTSLFSAIFITRLIIEWFLNKNKTLTFSTPFSANAFKNVNFDFLGKSKYFYWISILAVIISLISLFVRGMDPGVDFRGGRNFIIQFEKPVVTNEIAASLGEQFGENPNVITFGADNQVRITTQYKIDEESNEVDNEIQQLIYEGVKPYLPADVDSATFLNTDQYWKGSQKVGPTIADNIKRQAVFAVLFALICMFIYIILRFPSWHYGLGAVVSLVHDAFLIIGTFSLFYGLLPFSLEVDQSFIAALLTIVGYSVNDTVVIFDRVRENIKLYPKRDKKEIMNMALNQTLSRTFNTFFSTTMVIIIIFLFGGEVIRGFTFAMLLGMIFGTYSTLFIAAPVVYYFVKKTEHKEKKLTV